MHEKTIIPMTKGRLLARYETWDLRDRDQDSQKQFSTLVSRPRLHH